MDFINTPLQVNIIGVAYEIHKEFDKFNIVKDEYIRLINQQDPDNYIITNYFFDFIKENFLKNINELFNDDKKEKLDNFNIIFNKIKTATIKSTEERELIYKSINFAFSQNNNFKIQYIISILVDSCKAYVGKMDETSCTRGIIERLVTGVKSAIDVICSDIKNEDCSESYKELHELLSFDIDAEIYNFIQHINNENIKLFNENIKEEEKKKIIITGIINYLFNIKKYSNKLNKKLLAQYLEKFFGDNKNLDATFELIEKINIFILFYFSF